MKDVAPKEIDGFGGSYLIYPDGRIYSVKRKIFRKPTKNHRGYLIIGLYGKNKTKWFTVHGLVARYFIGVRPEGLTVNHKDGNKQNNHFSNLEYLTIKENINHALSLGLRWTTENQLVTLREARVNNHLHARKLKEVDVLNIRRKYSDGGISMRELGNQYGVNTCTIFYIVHGKTYKNVRVYFE